MIWIFRRKRLVGAKILGGLTLVLMLISKPQYNIFIDILGFILIVISLGGNLVGLEKKKTTRVPTGGGLGSAGAKRGVPNLFFPRGERGHTEGNSQNLGSS